MRPFYITRTGLRIGCMHVSPPHRMGSEAERIQAALLYRRKRSPRWLRVIVGYLLGSRP